jgi:hypothetical protein
LTLSGCSRLSVLLVFLGFVIRPGLPARGGELAGVCTSGAISAECASPSSPPSAPEPTSPAPSSAPSPLSEPSPIPLSRSEKATLLANFLRAQRAAVSGLQHQQKLEAQALSTAHRAAFKEWWKRELDAFREYRKGHKGPQIRSYYKDLMARQKVFLRIQADERARRTQENKARLDSEREEQQRNQKEFRVYLDRGMRPPDRLWPGQPGVR